MNVQKKNDAIFANLARKKEVVKNVWAEIYIENEWMPIIIKKNKYSKSEATEIESFLSWPVSYCVAFDGGVRDVTARYASEWLTETKKLRLKYVEKDTNWWKATCDIWPSRNKNLEKEENKSLQKTLKAKGLYKNTVFNI